MQFRSASSILVLVIAAFAFVRADTPSADQVNQVKTDIQAVDKATSDLNSALKIANITDYISQGIQDKSQTLANAIQTATTDVHNLSGQISNKDAQDIITSARSIEKKAAATNHRLIRQKQSITASGVGPTTLASVNNFRALYGQFYTDLCSKMPTKLQETLKKVADKSDNSFSRASKAFGGSGDFNASNSNSTGTASNNGTSTGSSTNGTATNSTGVAVGNSTANATGTVVNGTSDAVGTAANATSNAAGTVANGTSNAAGTVANGTSNAADSAANGTASTQTDGALPIRLTNAATALPIAIVVAAVYFM